MVKARYGQDRPFYWGGFVLVGARGQPKIEGNNVTRCSRQPTAVNLGDDADTTAAACRQVPGTYCAAPGFQGPLLDCLVTCNEIRAPLDRPSRVSSRSSATDKA